MSVMNKVVERGVARCPRCVSVADYTFVECEQFLVRYEVQCRRCGDLYVEQISTAPTVFSTALEPYVPPEPDRDAEPLYDRLRVQVGLWWATTSKAAAHARSTAMSKAAANASAALTRARTWASAQAAAGRATLRPSAEPVPLDEWTAAPAPR